ncbi:putative dioxygenase [Desulfamplus magnetovallimortis]|uniref:Putative dioxygenase n=1 Tax=Desulfamplus magnetovallimortis TaxID=1246637 RepID=A0A1W1HA00_9BACT|nr:AmmeMemoRadiSam system protein B [Desulfamplus magnetovallimortis]SLM29301.1 putative dioxygenase [Desulfamplus magnetovallimortis]
MQKKRAAFSGSWYPEDALQCRKAIEQFLTENSNESALLKGGKFSGGIVPHAGWFFSGSIACRVISAIASSPFIRKTEKIKTLGHDFSVEKQDELLSPSKPETEHNGNSGENIDAVVIFGMHMHPSSSSCIMVEGKWETPLGYLDVHQPLAASLADRISIRKMSASTFPDDNTIELQLPFIKYFFPNASIVPVGVAPTNFAEKVGTAAVECADSLNLSVVFIGSTDMTHYGKNYGFFPAGSGAKALEWMKNENDQKAIRAMVAMESDEIIAQGIGNRNLCCAGAVAAAVGAVKKMGAVKGIEFDYATSYDKSPGSSFVGYSGILFSHNE